MRSEIKLSVQLYTHKIWANVLSF